MTPPTPTLPAKGEGVCVAPGSPRHLGFTPDSLSSWHRGPGSKGRDGRLGRHGAVRIVTSVLFQSLLKEVAILPRGSTSSPWGKARPVLFFSLPLRGEGRGGGSSPMRRC